MIADKVFLIRIKRIKSDKKSTELYNTKLPWDLRLAYSVTYNNSNRQNEISSNSLMISGNIELAPRWKVGFSSGYDFEQKELHLHNYDLKEI